MTTCWIGCATPSPASSISKRRFLRIGCRSTRPPSSAPRSTSCGPTLPAAASTALSSPAWGWCSESTSRSEPKRKRSEHVSEPGTGERTGDLCRCARFKLRIDRVNLQAISPLLAAVLTVTTCYAAGALLIALLGVSQRPAEKLPLAFLLGAACVHWGMFALFALGLAIPPVFLTVAGAV